MKGSQASLQILRKRKIVIIGAGSLGTALPLLLSGRGVKIAGIAGRSLSPSLRKTAAKLHAPPFADPRQAAATGDLILLAVPDDAIQTLCQTISEGGIKRGGLVGHFSGALPSSILSSAQKSGGIIFSLHPIGSFPSPALALERLQRIPWTFEGMREALPYARALVTLLGGSLAIISKEAKPLYHAACCIASNYLVTLLSLAGTLLQKGGMREDSHTLLLPLVEGTLGNIEEAGPVAALTGPLSRGDEATIRLHLSLLKKHAPELLPLYSSLGVATLELVKKQRILPARRVRALKELLTTPSTAQTKAP